ncbi:type IV pilin N-terminal domain-containing protein [Methanohalobium sp.]|uniref:type IV pilin N-terminal domain-containing protein n=1 Tax=Methanohalobium sp. TaxID=2837493 RepID=UPI0025F695BF|nr:type IV pilin N-terminal domain-containing protein [Methanohalobium sp.]
MNITNKFSLDTKGVSPVVGVILMVAITVILAAVIGTFVLGLGDQVNQNAQAGVTFDSGSNEVDVQLNSVQSADAVYVNSPGSQSGGVTATDSTDGNYLLNSNGNGGVGTTVTVSGISDGQQITVIGVLNGEENIIQTYNYSA